MEDRKLIDPENLEEFDDPLKDYQDWRPNYKTVLKAMVWTPFYTIAECFKRGPKTIILMPIIVPFVWVVDFGSILGQWMTRDFSTGAWPTGCFGSLVGICLVVGAIISMIALMCGIRP